MPGPPGRGDSWLPRVISAGCVSARPSGGFAGHQHAEYDELTLITRDPAWVRIAGRERQVEPGTAFLHRAGEVHAYRTGAQDAPLYWVVHFVPDPELCRACPRLADSDPERRCWHPGATAQAGFHGLFLRTQAELAAGRPDSAAAASAWLRLMLIAASRWGDPGPELAPPDADPALSALWELIHDHADRPVGFSAAVRTRIPNYDSLRHRFRRVYGMAPREALARLSIERAKALLLEPGHTVAAVARRQGYARANEFIRSFRRRVGRTPSAFCADPADYGSAWR